MALAREAIGGFCAQIKRPGERRPRFSIAMKEAGGSLAGYGCHNPKRLPSHH